VPLSDTVADVGLSENTRNLLENKIIVKGAGMNKYVTIYITTSYGMSTEYM
jgi:hypothetical protein